MSKTKVPAIPLPRAENLLDVAKAVKGILDVREGAIGDPLDQNVTYRDLVDSGLAQVSAGGYQRLTSLPPIEVPGITNGYNPVTDFTIPDQPSGVVITSGTTLVKVKWDLPAYANHAYAEVWRATTNAIGNAVLIGTSDMQYYVDRLGQDGGTWYYWVRFISQANVAGPYNSTNGTSPTSGLIDRSDVAYLDAAYITAGYLSANRIQAGSLDAKIANIDAAVITSGIIGAARIGDASITSAKIVDATITGVKIADATIGTAKIVNAAITTVKIGDAAITTAKIGDLAVDTLKIQDNAVSLFSTQSVMYTDRDNGTYTDIFYVYPTAPGNYTCLVTITVYGAFPSGATSNFQLSNGNGLLSSGSLVGATKVLIGYTNFLPGAAVGMGVTSTYAGVDLYGSQRGYRIDVQFFLRYK